MASTRDHVIGEAWEEVLGGDTNITIQPNGKTTFLMHLTTDPAQPADDAASLMISSVRPNMPSDFVGVGLPEGTKIWLRQFQGREATVTIVSY